MLCLLGTGLPLVSHPAVFFPSDLLHGLGMFSNQCISPSLSLFGVHLKFHARVLGLTK